ncbi:hypothetical protein KBY77_15445 [Synechococcus sp. Cruz-7E5]|nr:hypothetical protein [Synechococcus sp. Cruz-7E5]MCP9871783.1 hypothetical protein [Synechococcus sp. Cruz-7B9]
MHSIHTYDSWLNQVERWFGIITQRAIRRGSFSSVVGLIARIEQFVAVQFNRALVLLNWTATGKSILEKLQQLSRVKPLGRLASIKLAGEAP